MQVRGIVPHLLDGMSVQPPEVRTPTQSQFEVNTLGSAVFGLGKRPGSRYLGNPTRTTGHFVALGAAGRFWLGLGQAHRVGPAEFGANPANDYASVPIDYGAGLNEAALLAYAADDPAIPGPNIIYRTFGKTTYIINRKRLVAMTSAAEAAPLPVAVIEVRQAAYDTDYTVGISYQGTTIQQTVRTGQPVGSGTQVGSGPPGAFALTSPTNGAGLAAPKGNAFSWAASSGATEYLFELSKNSFASATPEVIISRRLTATNYEQRAADPDIPSNSFWRVTAINRFGRTVNQRSQFGIGAVSAGAATNAPTSDPPAPFAAVAPRHQTANLARRPRFEWSSSAGATSYELQIATDVFSDRPVPVFRKTIVGTAYEMQAADTALDANRAYRWRVIAKGPGGERVMRDGERGWSFRTTAGAANTPTAPGVPAGPVKVSPITGGPGGTLNLPRRVTLTWTGVGSSYRLQIAKDNTFSTIVFDRVVSGTSYTLTDTDPLLEAAINHFWRVQAITEDGTSSFTSSPNDAFTVEWPAPETVVEDDDPAPAAPDVVQIAEQLAASLDSALDVNWIVGYQPGTRYITVRRAAANEAFTAFAQDSAGSDLIKCTVNNVQTFADLPEWAPNGYTVKVAGDAEQGSDDYWVRFIADDSTDLRSPGVWQEVAAPGMLTTLDPTTLPWVMVYNEATGRFSLDRPTWALRDVGDNTTNPIPTVVGRRIQDLNIFQNRLALLTEDTLVLSRSGDLYNLWKTTALRTNDDDPIDIPVPGGQKPSRAFALYPVGQGLVTMGSETQSVLIGGSDAAVTPTSVRFEKLSAYTLDPSVLPADAGNSLFVAGPKSNLGLPSSPQYTALYEFRFNSSQLSAVLEITQQYPTLITGGAAQLATAPNSSTLCVRTTTNRIHLYQWTDLNGERVQSSWRSWLFGTVYDIGIIDSDLYVVSDHFATGFVFLQAVATDYRPATVESPTTLSALVPEFAGSADSAVPICLDARCRPVSAVYNAVTDETTLTLPYNVPSNRTTFPDAVILQPAPDTHFASPGTRAEAVVGSRVLPQSRASVGNQMYLRGNHASSTITVGVSFACRYVFSRFDYRVQIGQGQWRVPAGRLQLLDVSIGYARSRGFSVFLHRQAREVSETQVAAPAVSLTTLGSPVGPGASGTIRIPILSRNLETAVELSIPGPYPTWFTGAVWTGEFSEVSR